MTGRAAETGPAGTVGTVRVDATGTAGAGGKLARHLPAALARALGDAAASGQLAPGHIAHLRIEVAAGASPAAIAHAIRRALQRTAR